MYKLDFILIQDILKNSFWSIKYANLFQISPIILQYDKSGSSHES